MAVFESLSDKMNHIFSKLRNKGKLTELEIKQAMREIRVALLEADVNFGVVKDFVAAVSEKARRFQVSKRAMAADCIWASRMMSWRLQRDVSTGLSIRCLLWQ